MRKIVLIFIAFIFVCLYFALQTIFLKDTEESLDLSSLSTEEVKDFSQSSQNDSAQNKEQINEFEAVEDFSQQNTEQNTELELVANFSDSNKKEEDLPKVINEEMAEEKAKEKQISKTKAVIVNEASIDDTITFSSNPENSQEIKVEIPIKIEVENTLLAENKNSSEAILPSVSEKTVAEENIQEKEKNLEKEEILVEKNLIEELELAQPEIPNPPPLVEEVLESKIAWQNLDSGLDYFTRKEKFFLEKLILDVDVHVLRINTKNYEIDLYGTFIDQSAGKSVRSWAIENDLLIAINASMYLPDNRSSNGYMRSGQYINNGQIMEKMSGFFFTKPKKENMEQSIIVEKDRKNVTNERTLDEYIDSYEVAIQNFRILGNYREDIQESELLWEQSSTKSSIAAYGDDIDGNIYFIFSRAPLSVYEFGSYMLSLANEGLYLKNLLYAEGGAEAGLFLETAENQYFIAGIVRNTPFSNIAMSVPNVLGIKKRVKAREE